MNARTAKKVAGAALAAVFTLGLAAPAFAEGDIPPEEPAKKCNSGGGNNSETSPENDCDPGNSAGHNNGKD